MRRLKPKGKRGLVMVKKLGRTFKTGLFDQIARKSARKYGSMLAGRKVAGKIFWKKVKRGKK